MRRILPVIVASASVSFGLASPSFCQVLATGMPILVDAGDNVVGAVVEITAPEIIQPDYVYSTVFALDRAILVRVLATEPNLLRGVVAHGPVFYTGSDCTGSPYLPGLSHTNEHHFLSAYVVNSPGGAVVYPLPIGTPTETITANSFLVEDGTCSPVSATVQVHPTLEHPTPFQGPYRVGARPLAVQGSPLDVPTADTLGLIALGLALLLTALAALRRSPEGSTMKGPPI